MGNIIEGYCNGCEKVDPDSGNCITYPRPMVFKGRGCAFSPIAKEKTSTELIRKSNLKQRAGQQKQQKKK
jgi:hypothetical protein